MDGVGAARPGSVEDAGDREIAVGGRSRTDPDGAIGGGDVGRLPVGVGEHGDRLDAQLAARAHNPHGDFAAIGDQQAPDHVASCRALGVLARQVGGLRFSRKAVIPS